MNALFPFFSAIHNTPLYPVCWTKWSYNV